MIKLCVFDMDGTVLDTITTITYFVNVTLEKFGLSPISEDECKIFVGNGAKKLIDRTLASKDILNARLAKEILDYYNGEYEKAPLYLTKPFDGIPELVDALHENGIKFAILSNKPDFVTRPIAEHFFGDKLDLVFGARDGVALKPEPDALFEIFDELGIKPCECAYIGDTGVDMKTGNNAAVARVIGVSWGFRSRKELSDGGADVIVDRPEEILREVLPS